MILLAETFSETGQLKPTFTKTVLAMTTNEVFRKVKEISRRNTRPRPLIAVLMLVEELRLTRPGLLPILTELKEHRLIKFNEPAALSIKLTLLGDTVYQ